MHGRVTLSSGKEADYYVDLRRITLDGEARPLVGIVMRDLVADLDYDAVGGLTLGADPVATAILHASAAAGDRKDAFVVRKAGKAHGLQQRIEGPSIEGRRVVVVEDTTTTGNSPLDAVRGGSRGRRRGRGHRHDRRPGDRCGRAVRGRGHRVPLRLRPRRTRSGLGCTARNEATAGHKTRGSLMWVWIIIAVVLVLRRAVGGRRLQRADQAAQPRAGGLAPDRRRAQAPARPDRQPRRDGQGLRRPRARHARGRHEGALGRDGAAARAPPSRRRARAC